VGIPVVIYQSEQPLNFQGDSPFPVVDDHDRGATNINNSDKTSLDIAALTFNWDISLGTLTAVSGYASYETDIINNTDQSVTSSLNRMTDESYEQWSQELRLVSPAGDPLEWIVGGYAQRSELSISRINTSLDFALSGPLAVVPLVSTKEPTASQFDQDSSSWALFAQGTYTLTDNLRLGLGLRYNEESKDLDKAVPRAGAGVRASDTGPAANVIVMANPATGILIDDLRSHSFQGVSRKEDKVTWAANLQWDTSEDAMLYASVSTGFKGGGFDEAYTGAGPTVRTGGIFNGEPDGGVVETGIDSSEIEYGEETVLSYEVGSKMVLAEGAANLNIALFRMEYEDLQVSSLVGDGFRVGNAGESVSQGVEIDGRWLLEEGFTLSGAVAYLDATYEAFTGATCTIPQLTDPVANPGCLNSDGSNITAGGGGGGGQDLRGETLLFAPEWSSNLSAEWIVLLADQFELRSNIDINYSGEFYSALDLDPNTKHDASTKVNLRVALADVGDTWSVAVVGKNLTDEKTMLWRNDVVLTDSGSYFGVPERGRSVAVQARYRF